MSQTVTIKPSVEKPYIRAHVAASLRPIKLPAPYELFISACDCFLVFFFSVRLLHFQSCLGALRLTKSGLTMATL